MAPRGLRGPGQGAYVRLAEALRQEGIVSRRLNYRYPDVLPECALDILAGVAYLQQDRARPSCSWGTRLAAPSSLLLARSIRTWRASWR